MLGRSALVLVGAVVCNAVAANNPAASVQTAAPGPAADSLSALLSQLRFPMPEGEVLSQSTNLSFHTRCGETLSRPDVILGVTCC